MESYRVLNHEIRKKMVIVIQMTLKNHKENQDPDEIREIIKEAPDFEEWDKVNIDDWLRQQIKDDNQEGGEEEEDGEDTEVEDDVPTHDEAFTCLEKAMKWLERQAESDTIQLLSLKRLRDLAAKKRVSSLKLG
ncbi:hypothetical protein QE152_g36986 [Popillia japonica]|uniref:Uncharacterized protein n=1 Tax=Popillia japonica TaxID=7064 RepID=A0AAW1IBX0_POPJA